MLMRSVLFVLLLSTSVFADRTKLSYLADYLVSLETSRSTSEFLHLADISWSLSLPDMSREFLNAVISAPEATKIQLSRAHFYLAILSFQDNDYVSAKAHAEMSRVNSWSDETSLLIAQALNALGLKQEALVQLADISLDEAAITRGRIAMERKDYQLAKEALVQIPSNSEFANEAVELLIRACFKSQEFDQVVSWYDLTDTESVEALSYVIMSKIKTGEYSNARALYSKYSKSFTPVWRSLVEAALVIGNE